LCAIFCAAPGAPHHRSCGPAVEFPATLVMLTISAGLLSMLLPQTSPATNVCSRHCAENSVRLCTNGGLCSVDGWAALEAELDSQPVFVLGNAAGEPMLLEKEVGRPIMVCFADLFRAEAELANAKRLHPDLNLALLPVGMGDAVRRQQDGTAMIVPSQNECAAANLDPTDPSSADLVPLFGCTKVMKPRVSNPDVMAMPLFLSSADAQAAVDAALAEFAVPEGMSAQAVGLDILVIPLQKACELIATGKETRFEIHAPSKSKEWVTNWQGADGAANPETAERGEEGGTTDAAVEAAEKQAMYETLIDQRQEMLKRTGGAFPRPSFDPGSEA